MNRRLARVLPIAGALALAACGGGALDPGRALTPDDIRDLTGLSAPIETAAMQQRRQQEILVRADSLVVSTTHMEVALPDTTRTFRLLSECSGPRCELLDPISGEIDTVGLDESVVALGHAETIGSAHGITLMSQSGHHMGVDGTVFGAWMEHGSFVLHTNRVIRDEVDTNALYAVALGELTDRPLTGSATWLGIMVGTATAGDDEGDRLVGTAALNYDMTSGGLDAAFSGISNIDRGTAHTVEVIIFSNIPVGSDGTYATGQSGTRIQGGFYGPGHLEAAGIFEQSDILGAFGVRRQ